MIQALGFHLLFGDGKVGAVIPESAGGDVFVPLADVWNTGHAEARQLSAFRPEPVQQPCPPCPLPCLARLELLLQVLVLFGPSVGIVCWLIPPFRCLKLRYAP